MAQIVGLDFGIKRTGISISDSKQIIASPFKTIESTQLVQFLSSLVREYNIQEIVLGFPVKLDGNDTHITQNVLQLKEILEKKFGLIKVHLQDERFTSKIARQTISKIGSNKNKRDKALVDQVSATLILQDFLNRKKL
ncbi:MAG: Holliday junction resolvase RuvX [Bacteroidetes bacterium]|nr:Holliday junction resolvase RuvX [Bacteroidota bacterium]